MRELSKAKLKFFAALQLKKHRQAYGMFIVEGIKMVQELMDSGWPVHEVVALHGREGLLPAGVPDPCVADARAFAQLASLETPEGIAAIAGLPGANYFNKPPVSGPGFVLDAVQDPGNLGTVLRIADWFGMRQVVCGPGSADCLNPKALRASMGSVFRVAIHYTDDLAAFLSGQPDIWLSATGGLPYHTISWTPAPWIVIGNESRGISSELLKLFPGQQLAIPGAGGAESLNAAVAAGILAAAWYEKTATS